MADRPVNVRLRVAPRLQAMLVTGENLDAVAAWCRGRVEGRDIDRPEVAVPLIYYHRDAAMAFADLMKPWFPEKGSE